MELQNSRQREKLRLKPQKWSHQRELEAAVGKKLRIKVNIGGTTATITGELVAVDQFTVKIRDGHLAPVYFKSSLVCFDVLEAA